MTRRIGPVAALLAALSFAGAAGASGGWFPEYQFHDPHAQPGSAVLSHPGLIQAGAGGAYAAAYYWTLSGRKVDSGWGDHVDYACCRQYRTGLLIDDAAQAWLAARDAFMSESSTELRTHLWSDGHLATTRICYADAFLQAGQTLARLRRDHAQAPEQVRDWVRAQDAVFRHCGVEAAPPPAELPEEAPLWLRRERDYQRAAAQFYDNDHDGALESFQAIAEDAASPWSGIAAYLAIRTRLRAFSVRHGGITDDDGAELRAERDGAAAALVEDVAAMARPILDDPSRAAWHGPTRRLWRDAQSRAFDRNTLTDTLAAALRQPESGADPASDLRNDLALFQVVSPAVRAPWFDDKGEPPLRDDLALWAAVLRVAETAPEIGRLDDETTRARLRRWVVKRWRERGGRPWLIAALWLVPRTDAAYPALRRAAGRAARDRSDPAYFTTRLFLARERLQRGDPDGARRWALPLLEHPAAAQPNERNLLHWLLLPTARTEDEFRRWLIRRPALAVDPESRESAPAAARRLLDRDGMIYFNSLPLTAQLRLARSLEVEADIRRRMFGAAWTRAYLLKEWGPAREAARELAAAAGASAADQDWYTRFAAERDPARLHRMGLDRFLAAGLEVAPPLLRADYGWLPAPFIHDPADAPDAYREFGTVGKWCSFKHLARGVDEHGKAVHPPRWLSAGERRRQRAEAARLAAIAPVSVYYSQEALALARRSPQDPAVPAMLSTAVRMARFTCSLPEVGRWSRDTLRYLHRHYPDSEAAAATRYWYSGK